ncbi:hypothetical protein GGTG_12193 [Gaeumannomyces tritici R3-111a-1]|uniref:Uncharacterized protein n=1 Tax=Gaeumannomyces tritici (strain R3-111a-1) TaxID=644352 RepID=J3PFB6_GAET3|nr:hypothetical protein GGTG_12193 [Gaeumannomyces tritici R3-111a-1]EJT70018.1 hypothetical protein GGTG_12193 [Gaeumannomyces tritici R3-111a-1]
MSALFSCSIRKRKEWAAAIPLLYQSRSIQWRGMAQQDAVALLPIFPTQLVRAYQPTTANHGPGAYEVRAETTLIAHDIAIPYPGTLGEGDDVFRFMLVSPDDAGDADTDARLDRLYNLGAHVGVVFLSQDEGCNGFTEFQIRSRAGYGAPMPRICA